MSNIGGPKSGSSDTSPNTTADSSPSHKDPKRVAPSVKDLAELLMQGRVAEFNSQRPPGTIRFSDLVVSKKELNGVNLTNCTFENCTFISCSMRNALILGACFTSTTFVNTICDHVQGLRASFINCEFHSCQFVMGKLSWVTFDRTAISNTRFDEAGLTGATFRHCMMRNLSFNSAVAESVSWVQCQVESATFESAVLCYAELRQSYFKDVSFRGADMRSIRLVLPWFRGQFSVEGAGVVVEDLREYMFDSDAWKEGAALAGAVAVAASASTRPGQALVGGESTATLIDEIPGTDQKLYDQAMRQLGKLAGLEEIKREFQELVAVLRINKQRAHLGLSSEPPLSHYIFSGPPGTGKTTVARILGSILKSLGYLSKGQFVETDRAGLIGRYLGETAVKTTKVVEQALGGVLFIDEAYALASKHELDSYSTEAVATLLKLMEDKRKEFVVIAAGYGAEMRTFIESNPGLESRFSQHVQFGSYSAQALTEIFAGFMANSGFLADAETTKGVSRLLEMLKERGTERFGNARVVRVLFDKMTRRQSVRLLKEEGVAEKVRFSTFTFEDIPCEEMLSVSNERLRELVNDPAALSSNEPQVFIDPKIAFRGAFFAN